METYLASMQRLMQILCAAVTLSGPGLGGAGTAVEACAPDAKVHSPDSAAQPDAANDLSVAEPQTMATATMRREGVCVSGDKASVSVEGASLTAVLTRLATQAEFRLQIAPQAVDRHIDAHFADLGLLSALRVLLEGTDYVVTLDAAGADRRPASVQVVNLHPSQRGKDAGAPQLPDSTVLLRAIDPASLPPGIHEDLQRLAAPPDPAAIGDIRAQRQAILDLTLDRLAGSIDASIIRDLRQRLSEDAAETEGSDPAQPLVLP